MYKKINSEDCREKKESFHIYCQIPFCRYRCPYCQWVSVFNKNDLTNLSLIPEYVKSLTYHINNYTFPDYNLHSIIFGGGTPSLLNSSQTEMIVEALISKAGHLRTKPFWMSFETTPELATKKKLLEFKQIGFNRVSIGVQSFIDEDLKLIGRANKSRDAFTSIDNARSAGYDAINIDLLAGFPGSTFEKWSYNLETAFKLGTECITINMMEFNYEGNKEYMEKNIRRGYSLPSFTDRVRMYEHALNELKANEYRKSSYAVFCKPGFHFQYEVSGVGLTDGAVCAFGPWVVSHLDGIIYQSYPFIREYIRQPLFKEISCSYLENAAEVIRGQLICYGSVRSEVVEPFLGCTIKEALEDSKEANMFVEDLISKGYVVWDKEGLLLREDMLSAGLMSVWNSKSNIN